MSSVSDDTVDEVSVPNKDDEKVNPSESNSMEDARSDASHDASPDTNQNTSQSASQNASPDTNQDTSQSASQKASHDTSHDTSQNTSQDISEDADQDKKKQEISVKSSKSRVDLVLISDDEGDDEDSGGTTPEQLNGQSPNGVESVESDDLDDLGIVEEYSDEVSSVNQDDDIEITGVSMANNEFGTVGGMDQLLRTLIDQGWTENEIMHQLRGMIAPYQRKQRQNVFNSLDDVVECIKRVNKIIVVSGAGISVSCGIPDFRSETGLYARLSKDYPTLPNPTAMFDLHYFLNDPKPFYTFAKELWPGQFKPSPCHRFIKLLESHGKLLRNYTQNIDTLEQVAGIDNVIQCHGSFATASCIYCRFQVSGDDIKADIMESRAPLCPKCEEKRLLDGQEEFEEFARKSYREIKQKLRRREKLSCAHSSDSDSSGSTYSDKLTNDMRRKLKEKGTKVFDDTCEDSSPTDRVASQGDTTISPLAKKSPDKGKQNEAENPVNKTKDCDKDADETDASQAGNSKPAGADECGSPEKMDVDEKSPYATENDASEEMENGSKSAPADVSDVQGNETSSTTLKPEDEQQKPGSSKGTGSIIASLLHHEPQPSSSRQTEPSTSDIDTKRTTKPPKVEREPLDPLLKPDIVFFGEDLPRTVFDHAEEDIEDAELIIVVGSSMKVKPVASIPEFARESTPRILINREPVRHISFDAELLGDADEIVQQLCHRLEWDSPVDESRSDLKRPLRPRVVALDELTPLPKRCEVEKDKAAAKSRAEESSKKKSDEESSKKSDEENPSKKSDEENPSKKNDEEDPSKKIDEEDPSKKNDEEKREDESKDAGTSAEQNVGDDSEEAKSKKRSFDERHEIQEACPLFGSRCQCPLSWNIAQYLPKDAVVKMQPFTYIFPGATVNHPKHMYTTITVNDSLNVDSDSDLGGMENPIEVSSSDDGGSESSGSEVLELLEVDSGNNSVSLSSKDVKATDESVISIDEPEPEHGNVDEKEKLSADVSDEKKTETSESSSNTSGNVVASGDAVQSTSEQNDSSKNVQSLKRRLSPNPENDPDGSSNGKVPRIAAEDDSSLKTSDTEMSPGPSVSGAEDKC